MLPASDEKHIFLFQTQVLIGVEMDTLQNQTVMQIWDSSKRLIHAAELMTSAQGSSVYSPID